MEFHYVEKVSIKFSFWNEAGTKGLINIVNKQLATLLLFIKFLVNKSNIGDLIIIIIIIIIINCLTPVMYACLSVSHTDDVVMPFG